MIPQPLLALTDVEASTARSRKLLGYSGAAPCSEFERLGSHGVLIGLHSVEAGHDHGGIADPEARHYGTDGSGGPNHRKCWVRDPDGYAVVLAQSNGPTVADRGGAE